MHTKAIGQVNGKLHHCNVNIWVYRWRFWVIRRILQLFTDDIRVGKTENLPCYQGGCLTCGTQLWVRVGKEGTCFPPVTRQSHLPRGARSSSGAGLFALPSGSLRKAISDAEWRGFKFLALSLLWWMEMSTILSVVLFLLGLIAALSLVIRLN